jgi:hypothetical protein
MQVRKWNWLFFVILIHFYIRSPIVRILLEVPFITNVRTSVSRKDKRMSEFVVIVSLEQMYQFPITDHSATEIDKRQRPYKTNFM